VGGVRSNAGESEKERTDIRDAIIELLLGVLLDDERPLLQVFE